AGLLAQVAELLPGGFEVGGSLVAVLRAAARDAEFVAQAGDAQLGFFGGAFEPFGLVARLTDALAPRRFVGGDSFLLALRVGRLARLRAGVCRLGLLAVVRRRSDRLHHVLGGHPWGGLPLSGLLRGGTDAEHQAQHECVSESATDASSRPCKRFAALHNGLRN